MPPWPCCAARAPVAVHRCHPYKCPVLDYFDELDRHRLSQLDLIADDLEYRSSRDYEHEQALLFEEEILALAWHHECPDSQGDSELDSSEENPSDLSQAEDHGPKATWQCDCCSQRSSRKPATFTAPPDKADFGSTSSTVPSRRFVETVDEQGQLPATPLPPSQVHMPASPEAETLGVIKDSLDVNALP